MWIFIHPFMVKHSFSHVPLQIRTFISHIYCRCLQCTLAMSKRKCGKNCVVWINYSQWLWINSSSCEGIQNDEFGCNSNCILTVRCLSARLFLAVKAAPPALEWDSSCKGFVGKYFTCCRCFMHIFCFLHANFVFMW